VLAVDGLAAVFDVTVTGPDGASERYSAVSVGAEDGEPRSLLALVELGTPGSQLVLARHVLRSPAMLPVGTSQWTYLECTADRFDSARFDAARFVGRPYAEVGLFDVSRYAGPHQELRAVFGGSADVGPAVAVTGTYAEHVPGTVVVNLPADLPPAHGARYDSARYAATGAAQSYPGAVLEPPEDPDYLPTLVAASGNGAPGLVTVTAVSDLPPGVPSALAPFRRPRRLEGGRLEGGRLEGGGPEAAAVLYLREATLPGALVVAAARPGDWGNDIEIAVRPAGPGRFDVTVAYAAAVYECARARALGDPPRDGRTRVPPTGGRPSPAGIGLAQARAAGVELTVTRDRTYPSTVTDAS
jgi:hypothetical protein